MHNFALIVMLFLMAGVARAEWSFTLSPTQSQQDGVVNLRVEDTDFQCFSSGVPEVVRDGTTIRVRYEIEDFIPSGTPPGICPVYRVTPRLDSLGTFATGHYTVEVRTCSNPTPPDPPCRVETTLSLTVLGVAGTRFTVPTLSGAVWILLVCAVMVIGAVSARRS